MLSFSRCLLSHYYPLEEAPVKKANFYISFNMARFDDRQACQVLHDDACVWPTSSKHVITDPALHAFRRRQSCLRSKRSRMSRMKSDLFRIRAARKSSFARSDIIRLVRERLLRRQPSKPMCRSITPYCASKIPPRLACIPRPLCKW